jgi:hypothetical protein
LHALSDVGRCARNHERGGGVEQHDVAGRAGEAEQHIVHEAGGFAEVVCLELFGLRSGQTERGRVKFRGMHRPAFDVADPGSVSRGDLIHSVKAVNDHGAFGAEAGKGVRHLFDCALFVDPDQLP